MKTVKIPLYNKSTGNIRKEITIEAETLAELRAKAMLFVEFKGYGASDVGTRWTVTGDEKAVRMSYNGKLWDALDCTPLDIHGEYKAQSARDAKASGYGAKGYWDSLEEHAHELAERFKARGDHQTAARMFTRSLSEALAGNDGI
jgi:hypothetical protein